MLYGNSDDKCNGRPPSNLIGLGFIRDLRLQTGLSQVEFGERCGFYQTYLSRIENGRANPTLNAIEVIANTLGLTVFELFDQVRERVPAPRTRKTRSKN
jgi:transcriptional regulator with XRE-family HTH domain